MGTIEYILYLFILSPNRLANHSSFAFALAWVIAIISQNPKLSVIQQLTLSLTGVPDTKNKSQRHGCIK